MNGGRKFMIKISKNIKDEYTNGKIQDLFDEVDSVLKKREAIQERYLRGITSTTSFLKSL